MSLGPDLAQQQPEEEQFLSTFFCRALFDYQTDNDSSLSFRRDDIIEVLTRLESGWWDGLLGQERGWFPSNYVTVISDLEADAALAAAEATAAAQLDFQNAQATLGHAHNFGLAHTQNTAASQEWDQQRVMPHGNLQPHSHALSHSQSIQPDSNNVAYPRQGSTAAGISLQGDGSYPRSGNQSSDFWVPQVSTDGRIYYVNTQTGQQSRDLPQDVDQDISDDVTTINGPRNGAGFGVPRRTSTPEPWRRVLADDGLSYYFVNTVDGAISLALPPASTQQLRPATRDPGPSHADVPSTDMYTHVSPTTRVASQTGATSGSESDRYSVHSDDSDVHPSPTTLGRAKSSSNLKVSTSAVPPAATQLSHSLSSDLTPTERSAQELQHALAAPPPESVNQLAVVAREAIGNVVQYIQTHENIPPGRYGNELNNRVLNVVYSVRNLLYVSATPSNQITNNLYPRDTRHTRTTPPSQALQAHLKPAQRKVAGTLSKLVLSTLAVQYEANHSQSADKPMRMEGDAGELDRAVVAFVTEVQRFLEQNAQSSGLNVIKRLHGVFEPEHVGLGLVGGGAAAGWKGFGWLALEGEDEAPNRQLSVEVITELKGLVTGIDTKRTALVDTRFDPSGEPGVVTHCHDFLSRLTECIDYISTVHVARHVDVDGFNVDTGAAPNRELYLQTVDKAKRLVRRLEVAVQAVYDEGASILMALQTLCSATTDFPSAWHHLSSLTAILQTNLGTVCDTFEALLTVGHDQAELGQGEYNGSIEWRMSRVSIIESRIASVATLPRIAGASSQPEAEDEVVNMEHAFRRPDAKTRLASADLSSVGSSTLYRNPSQSSETSLEPLSESYSELAGAITPTWSRDGVDGLVNGSGTMTPKTDVDVDIDRILETDNPAAAKSPPRAAKLRKILGDDAPQAYIDKVNADFKKWYLRSDHAPEDLQTDPEGTVKGGTIQALVERLTTHDAPDTKYNKTFLMTYKSFTTTSELFDQLVARFWIQPPDGITPAELEEWKRLKQHVVRARVLNTFKSMIVDNDILEEEDAFIFERMKEFISNEEVQNFAAAKQLGIHIERAQKGNTRPPIPTPAAPPPPSIQPKTSKKGEMKLSDVDPLEMARQLTLMEGYLYQKIRPIECLQRSRDSKGDINDNISQVIRFANKISDWVAETILAKDDSRRRASVVKNFIAIADRCKSLHNFPSMLAIVAGLNMTPIRRLKRTWEQVPQRFMTMLSQCETMLNTNKNFGNYRHKLSTIVAPCVPFIGVFLTQLTFINENPNMIGPNLINFRKRQKAAEVIDDIKRWQLAPYSFNVVPSVASFIEDSLRQFEEGRDLSDFFWNLSLEREPREREDEKMARLLQESGFL